MDIYKNELARCRSLSSAEKQDLFVRNRRGDEEAKKILFEANLKLVFSLVGKRYSSYADFEDLISVGNQALWAALDTYDCAKGNFSTYLERSIRNSVTDYLRNNSRTVRLPQSMEREYGKVMKMRSTLMGKSGEVDLDDLATACQLETSRVDSILSLNKRNVDMEEAVDNGYFEKGVGAYGPIFRGGEDVYSLRDESEWLQTILLEVSKSHPKRDLDVLLKSYGLGVKKVETSRLAVFYGITPERVRQIRRSMEHALRQYVVAHDYGRAV